MTLIAGYYVNVWEDELGLANITEDNALFTKRERTGFSFTKNFRMGMFEVFVSHYDEDLNLSATKRWLRSIGGGYEQKTTNENEGYEYGGRFKVNFNATLWIAGNYIKRTYDDSPYVGEEYYAAVGDTNPAGTVGTKEDKEVWWAALGGKFSGWTAKGAYYDLDNGEDDNEAWQAIVTVDQDVLKFTSLWLEYFKVEDEGFRTWFYVGPWDTYGTVTGTNLGKYDDIFFIRADQTWNDQWATFLRYFQGSARGSGADVDDTENYTVGVKYWYTPALSFELAYDKIENSETERGNDDNVIRLRTVVSF